MLGLRAICAVVALGLAAIPGFASAQDFRASMEAAMAKMDAAMMAPDYSGDADADFAAMMIAHHQGAVDMAQVELRFGTDQTLRRLAQGIIVEQEQEIDVMRRALAARHAAHPVPTRSSPAPSTQEPR